jgi:predicted dithiol-disulfide oxidoreductase (DUF899 family)
MPVAQALSPARELVATNAAHFPNESAVYRTARNALLAEEIELRRHIEHVAAQRRALPDGGQARTTSRSSAKRAPFASPACSATKTH